MKVQGLGFKVCAKVLSMFLTTNSLSVVRLIKIAFAFLRSFLNLQKSFENSKITKFSLNFRVQFERVNHVLLKSLLKIQIEEIILSFLSMDLFIFFHAFFPSYWNLVALFLIVLKLGKQRKFLSLYIDIFKNSFCLCAFFFLAFWISINFLKFNKFK